MIDDSEIFIDVYGMFTFSHIFIHRATCYHLDMAINLTPDNAPNPVQAYAGSTPGASFYQGLAETLNCAHANNSTHIFSQGFSSLGLGTSPFFVNGSAQSQINILEIQAPTLSRAHSQIMATVRAYHVSASGSTGTLKIRVFDGESGGTQIADIDTAISSSASAVLLNHTFSITVPTQDKITIQVGLGATGSGVSYIQDLSLCWVPLSTLSTTKSSQGVIIPVGTVPTADNEAASAALGFAFAATANTLQNRRRFYGGASGISKASTSTGEERISPFVRPHLLRVQDRRSPLTINYFAHVQNSHSTDTKDFRVIAINPRSLFASQNAATNFFVPRGESATETIAANSTVKVSGSFTIMPPFEYLESIADGHFVSLAIGTRAMAPRDSFGYNEGSAFDSSLKVLSYSFWGE